MEILGHKVTLALALLVIGVVVVGCVGVYAATSYLGSIGWTIKTEEFTVDQPTSINLGLIDLGEQPPITYTVTNTGNVPLTVAAFDDGDGYWAEWNSMLETIQPQESAAFTLTLTVTTAGHCDVNFQVVE
jgi:hypothetical protein